MTDTLGAAGLAPPPAPPPVLGGYRLGKVLGRGGMAAVYRAEQISLGRQVALKVIGPPSSGDAGFCERFLREAKLAAQINHPNIITVHDAGQERGFLFIALELVTGGDADCAATADGGRMEEIRALKVAIDCCHALIALDQAGLIHRDIKPANIFLTPGPAGERAKLADLGLARRTDGDARVTATGATMGTPAFMSPEQAEGKTDLDIRSDIYALGATLYALLTGQPPYSGSSAWSVIVQVLKDPVPDPRRVQPAISNNTASVVVHCLAKDPVSRYASAHQLLEDLQRAQAGRAPIHAPRVPHPSGTWNRITAAGPVPRDATSNRSTADLASPNQASDRDEDPLSGRGLWWIVAGVAVGAVIIGLGLFAEGNAPPSEEATATRVIETDLATLVSPPAADDPLRPRIMPLLSPDELAGAGEPAPVGDSPGPVFRPDPLPVVPTPPAVESPPSQPTTLTVPTPPPPPTPAPTPVLKPIPAAEPPAPPVDLVDAGSLTTGETPTPLPLAPPESAVIPAAEPLPPTTNPIPADPPPPVTASSAGQQAIHVASAQARQAALERQGYRVTIEALPSGTVAVTLVDKTITSLTPLQGLAIERLDAEHCADLTGDLASLTGMPLRELRLAGCKKLQDLRGLRGAPIERLTLAGCAALAPDLISLTGSKVTHLDLTGCRSLTSLTGLTGLPLVELNLTGCTGLTDLAPLRGVRLRALVLDGCTKLAGDCSALAEAPLERLGLHGCKRLASLNGLTVSALSVLDLRDCETLVSLAPLRGARLGKLDASGCTSLTSLDGLQGLALTELRLYGCRNLTGDFTALRGMPLTLVDASYCSRMTSLNGLQKSPLRTLILTRNTGLVDYVTLAGISDLDIQR